MEKIIFLLFVVFVLAFLSKAQICQVYSVGNILFYDILFANIVKMKQCRVCKIRLSISDREYHTAINLRKFSTEISYTRVEIPNNDDSEGEIITFE